MEILEFNLAGPVLAVRPYVHNDYYWQVYFDTNRVIRETFGEANFSISGAASGAATLELIAKSP